MKETKTRTIIKYLITFFQVLILIPTIVLQYLSNKKMGVKRYLIFKKAMLAKGIFSASTLLLIKVVLILVALICIYLLVKYYFAKTNSSLIRTLLIAIILNLSAVFYLFLKNFEQLLTYHFFLISILIIVILQHIKVFLFKK